jgi:hypothetical protein
MASKKKSAKRNKSKSKTKVAKKTTKKKSSPVKLVKSKPTVAAVVLAAAAPTNAPPIVVSYELVALRAFQIWQRKIHTNHPEHNWREAEAELRAELLEGKK